MSLARTFLSDLGSESEIGRLGGWGWRIDPEQRPHPLVHPHRLLNYYHSLASSFWDKPPSSHDNERDCIPWQPSPPQLMG